MRIHAQIVCPGRIFRRYGLPGLIFAGVAFSAGGDRLLVPWEGDSMTSVYPASKAHHAEWWKALRAAGVPISCSWILAYVWLARMLRIHSLYNSVQTRRQAMPTSKRL